eukprot:c37609_g1_i1 orf=32-235(+)
MCRCDLREELVQSVKFLVQVQPDFSRDVAKSLRQPLMMTEDSVPVKLLSHIRYIPGQWSPASNPIFM